MIENDEREKERVDARNALEESVYDLRDKFSEEGALAQYIENGRRQTLVQNLNELENWLYEDGEDCSCEIYRGKLQELHSQTDPVKERCYEFEQQPQAFRELGHTIQMARKSVDEFHSKNPKYDHITETEKLNVSEAADRAEKWLNDHSGRLQNNQRTIDPPVRIHDIRSEIQTLSTCLNSVLNRPKPKPPTPPANNGSNAGGQDATGNNTNTTSGDKTKDEAGEPTFSEDKMDVE